MKKYLCSIFFFIICLNFVYGCEKKVLPIPVYPLDIATVNAAIEEAGLSWTIVKEEHWTEEEVVYTLHNKDDKLIAFVFSRIKNERRVLDVTLMPYLDNPTITQLLPEEEWEMVIVFATLLYGGFDSKYQVYERFTNDYDTKNTVKGTQKKVVGKGEVIEGEEELFTWYREINGIYCLVRTEQPYASMPQRYLTWVRFDNTDEDATN